MRTTFCLVSLCMVAFDTTAYPVNSGQVGNVNLGNVQNSSQTSQGGESGVFTGDSGSVSDTGNSFKNMLSRFNATIKNVEIGNTVSSTTTQTTGNAHQWGDSGSVVDAGNAFKNTVEGSSGSYIKNLMVGNSIGNKANSGSGKGGFLGGSSGSESSVGNAFKNSVKLSPGTQIEGSVGTVQGSTANSYTGGAHGFGDSGSIADSGNGFGNEIKG